jgi:hypothetical protein
MCHISMLENISPLYQPIALGHPLFAQQVDVGRNDPQYYLLPNIDSLGQREMLVQHAY